MACGLDVEHPNEPIPPGPRHPPPIRSQADRPEELPRSLHLPIDLAGVRVEEIQRPIPVRDGDAIAPPIHGIRRVTEGDARALPVSRRIPDPQRAVLRATGDERAVIVPCRADDPVSWRPISPVLPVRRSQTRTA